MSDRTTCNINSRLIPQSGIKVGCAINEATRIDAQGYYDDFVVGGTSDTPEIDNEAPEIRAMFFYDSAFVNGGKVNSIQTHFSFIGRSV